MSSPIPEHGNSWFWVSRDQFVIVQAVLNIMVQAISFARVFFVHKRLKNQKAIGYLKIVFLWTTLVTTKPWSELWERDNFFWARLAVSTYVIRFRSYTLELDKFWAVSTGMC